MTRRRRIALAIQSWLYKLAFWLDVHTAPKYDPAVYNNDWLLDGMTDDEWDIYFEGKECE